MKELHNRLSAMAVILVTIPTLAPGEEPDDAKPEPAVSAETLATLASTSTGSEDSEEPTHERPNRPRGVVDEIELDRTEITGNQELPKMLYIVPWQKAVAGDLVGKPESTALADVLAPIDRPEFMRKVDYFQIQHREAEKKVQR